MVSSMTLTRSPFLSLIKNSPIITDEPSHAILKHMPPSSNNSLLKKAADLYQDFQQTLNDLAHEHLEDSKKTLQEIDKMKQEDLRKMIQGE